MTGTPDATKEHSTRLFVVAGLLIAAALALFVAPFASSAPDGLERVAADEGIDIAELDHHLDGSPFADYGVEATDSNRLGTAVAGLTGVLLTFGVAIGVFASMRVARSRTRPAPASGRGGAPRGISGAAGAGDAVDVADAADVDGAAGAAGTPRGAESTGVDP